MKWYVLIFKRSNSKHKDGQDVEDNFTGTEVESAHNNAGLAVNSIAAPFWQSKGLEKRKD